MLQASRGGVCLLSCSWRPPPARPPAPPWEGRWGEVLSRSPAPRCSCSRNTSPTLHPDKPHSLWRCVKLDFLMGKLKESKEEKEKKKHRAEIQILTSYFHCWMVWNYPWGSWENWKAGQVGDKREDLIVPPGEQSITFCPRAPHLYLSLFSRVFDGLEDVPGASPSHLWASNVLTVPSLNQDGRSQSCHTRLLFNINHINSLFIYLFLNSSCLI